MTAQELIASSLRLCGAIAGGEVPTADEFEDGLDSLRDILEHWTVEGLTPHATLDQTFAITDGVTTYSIGPGATWAGYRPVRVKGVVIDGCPVPLARITYNATFPTATITIPEGSVGTAVITSELAFTLPDSSTDALLMPPGYMLALRFALASDLGPEYGLPLDAVLQGKANAYKADIKRPNIKAQPADIAPEYGPARHLGIW